jgi:cytochrome b561
MSLVLLGSGWYIQYMPLTNPARSYLVDLHISLGLTSAILLSIQIVLRIVFKPPSFPNEFPRWQKILSYTLYILIYFSFTLMIISGYLQAVFSGTPIQFWGAPLPVWGAADETLARFFAATHGIVAFVLAGSIFVHVCIGALNIFKHPGIAAQMPPLGAPESQELVLGGMAQRLAKTLRLLGWTGFWTQFVLAFVSALLLAIATTGHAFSPGSSWFGDALYFAYFGFVLSCFTVLLAFYYTRAARTIVSRPESYFKQENMAAFWFLGTGMLIGLLGILISFTGVALSISLLIAKTVSIPPGIMMMDPTQVIRAIDVFALMVNFNLLVAHFIGTGITLWLSISVSKATVNT